MTHFWPYWDLWVHVIMQGCQVQQFLKPKLVQQLGPTFYQCWSNNKSLWYWLDRGSFDRAMLRLRPFERTMLRLRPLSFVDRACHPETAGSRRTGTSIESIMAVTYLSHDQSRLVTYVTDCYAKVGPTFFLVQQSWTNFICWSNKKLDQQLATLLKHGMVYLMHNPNELIVYSRKNIYKTHESPHQC